MNTHLNRTFADVRSNEHQQGSGQPEGDPPQEACSVGALYEATELIEKAAKFYSGRVEEAALIRRGGEGDKDGNGSTGSPGGEVTVTWCQLHHQGN